MVHNSAQNAAIELEAITIQMYLLIMKKQLLLLLPCMKKEKRVVYPC